MKRGLTIFAWVVLSFLAAQMALAFASGILFATLISFGVNHELVPRILGIGVLCISIAIATTVLVLGVCGRLSGTERR
ncbi:hypothetical protein OKA05_00880 [Luteolibacter arcticus]|uniref:Uncharacterized protein n=1 Tax=Luteolibacter arcticus TaxID=1581411 RepID=A0ABT3GBT7_9BACT|nr:hypothetical protein [Luteolibacter arcticus]MCW1921085.1 hypothetical protein [Luteolibacter arcticus]